MSLIRLMLAVFVMIAFDPISAGGPLADLSIDAAVQPTGVTPPGTEGTVIITITNHGPNTGSARFTVRRTNDGMGFSFPPIEILGLLSGPCTGDPIFDPPPGVFFSPWIIRDIPAGESRACTFGFRILETSKTSQIMRWEVGSTGVADDPNDTNNVADVLLQFGEPPDPVTVPALSIRALMILGLLLGLVALFGLARQSKSSFSS